MLSFIRRIRQALAVRIINASLVVEDHYYNRMSRRIAEAGSYELPVDWYDRLSDPIAHGLDWLIRKIEPTLPWEPEDDLFTGDPVIDAYMENPSGELYMGGSAEEIAERLNWPVNDICDDVIDALFLTAMEQLIEVEHIKRVVVFIPAVPVSDVEDLTDEDLEFPEELQVAEMWPEERVELTQDVIDTHAFDRWAEDGGPALY